MELLLSTNKMKILLSQLLLPLTMVLAEIDFGAIQQEVINQNPGMFRALNDFDPSRFGKEVLKCQQHCGDGYYQCFMSCEDSTHITQPTKAFFEAQVKHKSNWSSYLLKLLTFGFLGNNGMIDKADKIYYEAPYVGDEQGMNDNLCLKNCTKLFRICYRHCVCKATPDEVKCMTDLVASSLPQRANNNNNNNERNFENSDSREFTPGFKYVTEKSKPTDYQFNWDKLQ